MIRSFEKLLIAVPLLNFLLPRWLIEVIARCAGTFFAMIFRTSRFGIERRVRGCLTAGYFGATNLKIDRTLQIEGHKALLLGNDVFLFGGSHFVAHKSNPITIGAGSHIGRNSVLSGLGGIKIGNDCLVSSGVLIYSITQNVELDPLALIRKNGNQKKQVTVGNDVWIGMGAMILPGVTVGDHAIIGAGAVVTKDVEPWHVVVGSPAKFVKDRRNMKASS